MIETAQPSIAPHKGLIREDLLVLRYILGLQLGHSLQTQLPCQKLPNASMKDVVFVAIDIEAVGDGRIRLNHEFQVGVSILDTRALQNLILAQSPGTQELQDFLQTYNFCVGSPKYCSKASRRFLFGQSETVNLDRIKPSIKDMVGNRDIVLVMHSGNNDLVFLKELDIDLQPICILDTQKAAQHPLKLDHRCTLEDLLVALECPFGYLHTAGNDANFTLRALLMIAVRDSERTDLGELQQATLSAIQAVAQCPRPKTWFGVEQDRIIKQKGSLEERQEKKRQKRIQKQEKRLCRKGKLAEQGG